MKSVALLIGCSKRPPFADPDALHDLARKSVYDSLPESSATPYLEHFNPGSTMKDGSWGYYGDSANVYVDTTKIHAFVAGRYWLRGAAKQRYYGCRFKVNPDNKWVTDGPVLLSDSSFHRW